MIQRHMHLKIVCFLHHYVQNFNNTWPLQQVQNCLRFFAIIAQNKTINSRPKCRVLVYQLVIVLTKQDYLIGLPTNCPYFPGHPIFQPICPTSLLWPIYAPQCIMSQFFSRDGKSQFKSQAEINCFLLTFIISVKKTEISTSKGQDNKNIFSMPECTRTHRSPTAICNFKNFQRQYQPLQGRPRLMQPGRECWTVR
jgi:hypothetical protein